MVDTTNPTTQFHPYQPETSTPHTESLSSGNLSGMGGLGNILNKFGLNNMDVRGGLGKMQGMARNNSGLVLGGLAALAIGAGLMRKRGMRTI
jgi:hypothetical protein